MFKHYYSTDLLGKTVEFYVGATADIKALYKSIRRNKATRLYPMFCDSPKFSDNKMVYALCVNYDTGYIFVVNSDTMLSMIVDGIVKEV